MFLSILIAARFIADIDEAAASRFHYPHRFIVESGSRIAGPANVKFTSFDFFADFSDSLFVDRERIVFNKDLLDCRELVVTYSNSSTTLATLLARNFYP